MLLCGSDILWEILIEIFFFLWMMVCEDINVVDFVFFEDRKYFCLFEGEVLCVVGLLLLCGVLVKKGLIVWMFFVWFG